MYLPLYGSVPILLVLMIKETKYSKMDLMKVGLTSMVKILNKLKEEKPSL